MWLKVLGSIFVICVLVLIYCLYRLHLLGGPKPKKKDKEEINTQTWAQQKQQVSGEIGLFLNSICLPSFLLEPRIFNQQLELLRFPNNKRYGDWRYDSNEEIILSSLQRPLNDFLKSLKKKGCNLKGLEEDFLRELVRQASIKNYQNYINKFGDFIREELDLQSACFSFFEILGFDENNLSRPAFMESLGSYYKEPMVFKTTARNNDDFNQAVGILDFLQKYFHVKGVTAAPMPIKELSEKLEEAFRKYELMNFDEV